MRRAPVVVYAILTSDSFFFCELFEIVVTLSGLAGFTVLTIFSCFVTCLLKQQERLLCGAVIVRGSKYILKAKCFDFSTFDKLPQYICK